MILKTGDLVLVAHRRLFDGDEARYFVGRTIASEGTLLKVEGFTFVKDLSNGRVIRKDERRIKVLSLASAGHIIYQLPDDANLETLDIESGNGEAVLVDGLRELMNLSEHTHAGHF